MTTEYDWFEIAQNIQRNHRVNPQKSAQELADDALAEQEAMGCSEPSDDESEGRGCWHCGQNPCICDEQYQSFIERQLTREL